MSIWSSAATAAAVALLWACSCHLALADVLLENANNYNAETYSLHPMQSCAHPTAYYHCASQDNNLKQKTNLCLVALTLFLFSRIKTGPSYSYREHGKNKSQG